jgi:hypothetical protein
MPLTTVISAAADLQALAAAAVAIVMLIVLLEGLELYGRARERHRG